MTIGGYSMDRFTPDPGSGSWIGTKGSKGWSGADRPKAPRVQSRVITITREIWDRKLRRFVSRVVRIRTRPYTPKRAKGKDPHAYSMNYLRQEQVMTTRPSPVTGVRYPDMWLLSQISGAGSWTNPGLLDSNDQIKLVGRLIDQLQGSDFNMSVFLGEAPQTLRLLADSAIRIRKAVGHARRLDVLGTARTLLEGTSRAPLRRHDWRLNWPIVPSAKNSASLWLELQYGWLPLLKDAEGAAQSLAHALNAPFVQTYRASVRKEDSLVFSDTYGAVKRSRVHRRSLVAYISENGNAGPLAALGLLDPELVAWELVPFSFVADWFIPIGQWMETRAKAGRLVGTFVTSDKRFALLGSGTFAGAPCSGFYRQVLFDRSISNTLSVPMPSFKGLDKVASWRHCANALALVTGMFSGSIVR